MVESYGRGCYETHFCPFQQICVTAGSGPDDKGIGIKYVIAGDSAPWQIYDIGIRFKYAIQKGNM
jgi:hypothetical protein